MDYAFVSYPLSMDYRKRFEAATGSKPTYLTVSELRRLPLFRLLKTLRELNADRLFIPIEDANSLALFPILEIIAIASNAKKRILVTPDMKESNIYCGRIFYGIVNIVTAFVDGCWALFKSNYQLDQLLCTARQDSNLISKDKVWYLKTNLWYGVKVGGSVGHIAGVVNQLHRLGYDVNFIAAELPTMIDPEITSHVIEPLSTYAIPPEINLYRFTQNFISQIKKSELPRPNFIYQRMSLGDYTGPVISRKFKIPLVLEYNGSEAWIAKNWGTPLRFHKLAVKAEEACLKHAHVIVTVSEVLKNELIDKGVSPERIIYYPNCIDTKVFNPNRFDSINKREICTHHKIAEDASLITFIGTFGQWHGVDILALAIRKLIDNSETWLKQKKGHFMLIGDGLNMPKVRQILQGEHYQQYVTFTGLIAQDKAPEYLAASDILVSPHIPNGDGSPFFGSPTKLFEYMAMGKGIIASDLNQIGEVLKECIRVGNLPTIEPDEKGKEIALMCKPGSVEELMEGICFLLDNPSWSKHLGENARREALSKYTWVHHVDAIMQKLTEQK